MGREPDPGTDLSHGAVVIELPAEVESVDADAAVVLARQQDCAAVQGLHKGSLIRNHLQSLSRPQACGDRGVRSGTTVWNYNSFIRILGC